MINENCRFCISPISFSSSASFFSKASFYSCFNFIFFIVPHQKDHLILRGGVVEPWLNNTL